MLASDFDWLPTSKEWEVGEEICKYLKVFCDATDLLWYQVPYYG